MRLAGNRLSAVVQSCKDREITRVVGAELTLGIRARPGRRKPAVRIDPAGELHIIGRLRILIEGLYTPGDRQHSNPDGLRPTRVARNVPKANSFKLSGHAIDLSATHTRNTKRRSDIYSIDAVVHRQRFGAMKLA